MRRRESVPFKDCVQERFLAGAVWLRGSSEKNISMCLSAPEFKGPQTQRVSEPRAALLHAGMGTSL